MLLQRTQAVRALQDGCSRLGLNNSTATALVQFLTVKRTHDQFVGDQDRELRMSPGAALDRLWHWMLLNTAGTVHTFANLDPVGRRNKVKQIDTTSWSHLHCSYHSTQHPPLLPPLPNAVSSKVHELVGGVVEHRGTDDQDLSDNTKLLQRLYGLNIMRLEGLEPDVQLWTVSAG